MDNKEKDTALADFNWDSEDFFADPVVETEEKVEVKEEETSKEDTPTDDPEDKEKGKEDPKEEVVEDDFFFEEPEENEDDVFKEKTSDLKKLFAELKEQGSLTVDFEDDFTEENVPDIIEREVEAQLEEAMSDFANGLDDEGKAFIKFKKEGGDTKQFFKLYKTLSETPSPIVGDDSSHEKFLKYYYSSYENMDAEEIEDRLDYLKEKGRLENYSLKYHNKVEENQEKEREQLVSQQKEVAKQREQQRQKLAEDLKEVIDTSDEIKNFPITPKDKKDLHKYMTKAVKKVAPGQYLTQLQSDLQEAFKDKQKIVLIAKLLKDDFDVSYLKKKAITEETKKTKEKLSNSKTKRRSSGKTSSNKGLADFF